MTMYFPKHLRIATRVKNFRKEIYRTLSYDGTVNYVPEGQFINLLSHALGFKYKIKTLEDRSLNRDVGGGNWTGVIGMLQRGEADIAVNVLFISEDRTRVIDFSYPYYLSEVTFITNQLQQQPKTLAIIYPFSLAVWLFLVLCLFSVSSIIYLQNRKRPLIRTFFVLFGSILEQSLQLNSTLLREKFLVFMWVCGVMFISHTYKGTLLAYLSFPSTTGVRDIDELAKAVMTSSYRCFTHSVSPLNVSFQQMNVDKMKLIGKSLSEHLMPRNYTLYRFLMNFPPKSAFITIRPYLIPYEKELYLSKDNFYTLMLGIGVRRGFCCIRALDMAVHRIFESGLYEKFTRETNALTYGSPVPKVTENTNSLTIEDTAGAFYILGIGHAVAILALLLEKAIFRFKIYRFWRKSIPLT